MLPNSNHVPTNPAKHAHDFLVSILISLNLRQPKCTISLWNRAASLASVPEAAVQENGKASARKNKVRGTWKAGTVSKPPTSNTGSHQKGPEAPFGRFCSFRFIAAHHTGARGLVKSIQHVTLGTKQCFRTKQSTSVNSLPTNRYSQFLQSHCVAFDEFRRKRIAN
jgi:hypothetical protein